MSRGLLLLLTIAAVGASLAALALGSPAMVGASQGQVDRHLDRSVTAFEAAASAAAQRSLSLAAESAQAGSVVAAVAALKGGAPDQAALDAAVGAVAARAEKRGEEEQSALLALATEKGAAQNRLGEATRFGDDLPTMPLAQAALGGVGKHSLAEVAGTLYRLVSVPVGPGENPAAALVLGFAVDDAFAQAMQKQIGADVTFVLGTGIVASSLGPAERAQISAAAASAGGKAFGFGALPADFSLFGMLSLPVSAPDAKALRGKAAPVPGLEGAQVIFSSDATSILRPVAEQQRRTVLLTLVVLVLGLVFTALGGGASGAPGKDVGVLASAAERLAVGEVGVRAPENLPGDLARLGKAINQLASGAPARPANAPFPADGPSEANFGAPPQAPNDPGAGLFEATPGPQADPGAGLFEPAPAPAPGPASFSGGATAPARSEPMPWEAGAPAPVPPPPPEESWDKPTASLKAQPVPAAARRPDDDFSGLLDGPPLAARAAPTGPPPPPPPARYDPFAAALAQNGGAPDDESSGFNPDATVVAAVPEALLRATTRAAPTSAPSRAPAPAAPSGDPDEAHFQQVFREFASTREKCGEPADGLTFDKFAVKLRKNREQLVDKYKCRTVRFTVYVKDGKAALKATPVKE